jgi:hypothetical protein
MPLPGLAQVGRLLANGAASSPNPRVRVDWNRFQDRLKSNTLRLCFADNPPAVPLRHNTLFNFSRLLIDGIIGVFSVASATVLCVGVPIVVFRQRNLSSAYLFTPWSTLNTIQELIVRQASTGYLFRSISLACLASVSFIIEAFLGCPRLAMMSLLPNIYGIIPHRTIADLDPLHRTFARISGIFISQILHASFCSLCLPSNPSFKTFAIAVLSPLPQRLLGVLYLELGREFLYHYPAASQYAVSNFPPPVNNGDEQGEILEQVEHGEMPNNDEVQGERRDQGPAGGAEHVNSELARAGLVFHSDYLSFAPTAFIHERVVTFALINPLIFTSELRSWHKMLQAFKFADSDFPGFFKSLLFGYWLTGCSGMLQNGCIASSLVLNELAAYLWGGEE